MDNQKNIEFIVSNIKSTLLSVDSDHFRHFMGQANEPDYHEEHNGWTDNWLETRIVDLYYHIAAFIELCGMPHYLEMFKKKFESRIENKTDLLAASILFPEGDHELIILDDFRRLLAIFWQFSYSYNETEKSKKLHQILSHTDFILKRTNAKVTNESDIYKQVKWVLDLYYPDARHKGRASFIRQFKTYSPDILIPELHTAIEYKYIREASNIDDFIDQVKVDADNYKGDRLYEHFIAVLYIEDSGIATRDNINKAWDEKRFPENWQLIIAMGSSQR